MACADVTTLTIGCARAEQVAMVKPAASLPALTSFRLGCTIAEPMGLVEGGIAKELEKYYLPGGKPVISAVLPAGPSSAELHLPAAHRRWPAVRPVLVGPICQGIR
ncbi:hypothetical protein HK101_001071 [Irineochytrium annulatum]|nr:hypothetical protein HK101_001071 [Irineochytrium annulatum]